MWSLHSFGGLCNTRKSSPTCSAVAVVQSACWQRLCRWTRRWRCRWGRCLQTLSITSPPDAPVFQRGYFGFCRSPAASPCGREVDDPPPPKHTHTNLCIVKRVWREPRAECYYTFQWLGRYFWSFSLLCLALDAFHHRLVLLMCHLTQSITVTLLHFCCIVFRLCASIFVCCLFYSSFYWLT